MPGMFLCLILASCTSYYSLFSECLQEKCGFLTKCLFLEEVCFQVREGLMEYLCQLVSPLVSPQEKSGLLIYRHTCLMNHQKSHQTNPMAKWDPILSLLAVLVPEFWECFFHSFPVPEFLEWIFFIPFPFPNLSFHRRES